MHWLQFSEIVHENFGAGGSLAAVGGKSKYTNPRRLIITLQFCVVFNIAFYFALVLIKRKKIEQLKRATQPTVW